MAEIEKITRQKEWYQLHLTSGEKLLVSEDQLVRYRLLKGQEVTPELLAEIKKSGAQEVGLQLAYHYLSYQLRSEKEVVKFLREKEVPNPTIKEIIWRLKELNLIDDLTFAESFVRTQANVGDKGPQVVAQKLKEKGVAPEVITEALLQYPLEQQISVAQHVAQRFLKRSSQDSFKVRQQKVKVHLAQKGFNQEVSQNALANLAPEKDDEQEAELLERLTAQAFHRYRNLPQDKRRQKVKETLYRKGFPYDELASLVDNFQEEE